MAQLQGHGVALAQVSSAIQAQMRIADARAINAHVHRTEDVVCMVPTNENQVPAIIIGTAWDLEHLEVNMLLQQYGLLLDGSINARRRRLAARLGVSAHLMPAA